MVVVVVVVGERCTPSVARIGDTAVACGVPVRIPMDTERKHPASEASRTAVLARTQNCPCPERFQHRQLRVRMTAGVSSTTALV